MVVMLYGGALIEAVPSPKDREVGIGCVNCWSTTVKAVPVTILYPGMEMLNGVVPAVLLMTTNVILDGRIRPFTVSAAA